VKALLVENRIIIMGEDVTHASVPGLDTAVLIITARLSDEIELKHRNRPALYFHRYAQSDKIWAGTVDAARDWIESWPKLKLVNGDRAFAFLEVENTLLWWFVHDVIWETKHGIFDTFYQVKTWSSLIKDYRPTEVELVGTFECDVREIISSLSKSFGFDLRVSDYRIKSPPQSHLSGIRGRSSLLVKFLLLKWARLFSRRKKNAVTFFLEHGSKAIETYHNGTRLITDHYLDGLEDYMTKNASESLLISLNTPEIHSCSIRNLVKEIFATMQGTYVPWLCYYSASDLKKGVSLVGRYRKKMMELESDPRFRESMVIDEIDVYPSLKGVLLGTLPRALALAHIEIEIGKKFVELEKPRLVFHVTGMSPSGRAISLACNRQGIRILAPQLGIISPEIPVNTAFIITKEYDKMLLPEYLVWGQFYKNLISERGYPQSLIKKVGFWRTKKPQAELPRDYILYVAGANLVKLDYILSFDEEIATINMLRNTIPKTMRLVVKLHPSLPYEKYRDALRGIISDIMLLGGPGVPGIEEFLLKAKIVVGKASTVLVQALILNKPVIALNFASKRNFLGFEGVPFATTTEEFLSSLNKILNGDLDNCNLNIYCDHIGQESISTLINEIKAPRNDGP
jgi:hypothetical protein